MRKTGAIVISKTGRQLMTQPLPYFNIQGMYYVYINIIYIYSHLLCDIHYMAVYVSPGGMYNVYLSNFSKAQAPSISLKNIAILLMENKNYKS